MQVNRPITMKKEGIQTRNRKMTSKTRRTTTSLVSRHASSVFDTAPRRLFHLRGATAFYDRPIYYQNSTPSTAVFTAQPGPEPGGFYSSQATNPQGYTDYSESYQMGPGLFADAGMGYAAPASDSYLSAVASGQQYLSAAAAGFHRHLHDLL